MAAVASKAREGGEMKGRWDVFIVPERPVRSNQQGVTYSLGARSASSPLQPSPSQTVGGTGGEASVTRRKELYINMLRVQWLLFCLIFFVQYEIISQCG